MNILKLKIEKHLEAKLRTLADDWKTEQGFWSAESLLESLEDSVHQVWIATEGEDWLGLCVMKVTLDEAELLYIHTHSKHRQKGISKLLLHSAVSDLRTASLKQVFLEVRPSNMHAIRLYESAGFREVSRRKRYYKDGEDALILAVHFSD